MLLALAGMMSFVVALAGSLSGQEGGNTLFENPFLAVTMLIAGAAGVGAGALAAYGIVARRDRATLLFLVAWSGLMILVFGLGEVVAPH